MKQWRNLAVVALVAAGLAFGCNAQAKADTDTDQYLNDMAAAGFTNTGGNQAEITVGMIVCDALAQGATRDRVAHELWVNSQLPSSDMAQEMVSIAVRDLCP